MDVQALVDNVKRDYPVLVEEIVPSMLNLGVLQKILQHLLKERIPVRDLNTILEAVGDYAAGRPRIRILLANLRVLLFTEPLQECILMMMAN